MDVQVQSSAAKRGAPSTWVRPARPVEPMTIECSAIDNLTAPVYPSPTKFWRLAPGDDPMQHFENMKRGLAVCLWVQPHLNGTLKKDENGRMSVVVPKESEQGVTFHFADLRDDLSIPSYDQFKEHGWPYADGNSDGLSKMRPDPFPTCSDGDPVVCPQFNIIRGGIVVSYSITHMIGDLVQCKDWIGIVAKTTRELAEARLHGRPEPPLPPQTPMHLMDRSRLRPKVPINHNIDELLERGAKIPFMTVLDPRDPMRTAQILEDLFTRARLTHTDLANHDEDDLRKLSTSVWSFPVTSIKRLQGAALQASPKGTRLSQIDCLTAFTWQRFFLAKWAPSLEGPTEVPEKTMIVFAGSVRHRLTPPLPHEYLPACVDLFPVTTSTAELSAFGPETLAKAAQLVRNSNNEWSEENYMEICNIAQSHPTNPGLVPTGPVDLLITDHTRATNELMAEWGPGLGLGEGTREPYLGRLPPTGEITLLPRYGDGTIEIMISGEQVVMDRLKQDPIMSAMATCKFIMHDFVKMIAETTARSKM